MVGASQFTLPTSGALYRLELQLQGAGTAACLRFPGGQGTALLLGLCQPALQRRPLSIPHLPGVQELGSHLGSSLLCFLFTEQHINITLDESMVAGAPTNFAAGIIAH